MSKLPEARSETSFEDFKPPYTKHQALVEANRCLYCEDAPCIQACPTSIDIPEFIRKIATGNLRGSAKTIFDSNILGMSCARVCPVETLCVGDCVYNELGVPPIQIGKLQRYATDAAFEEGWAFYEAGADTGRSVGLLGAGPASLACAHELRRLGHRCTIYEQREVLGGLNSTGVAPYKMPAERSVEEVDWILGIGGIEVKTGTRLPDDVSFAELEASHDAVFVGLGLGLDRLLGGEDELSNVHGAVDWIEQMKLGEVDLSEVRHAIVLGGGNTALDAVRELRGLGVEAVTLVYRGDEQRMSGYAHEWDAAKVEGVRGVWRTQPLGYATDSGRATGVRCVRLDEAKQPVEGTEHVLEADLVLVAIGQSKLGAMFGELEGLTLEWGRLVTDEDGFTGRPGWYAGGDCANGGKEVVNAAAEGKRAAHAIHAKLMNGGA